MNRLFSIALFALLACLVLSPGHAARAQSVPPVTVYEVDLPDAASLATLTQSGLDVANVSGLTATVYVREDEQSLFISFGWPARVVEVQPGPLNEKLVNGYRSNPEIAAQFSAWQTAFPNLCRYQSIGQSVNGQDLWVIKITQDPDTVSDKPAVAYISTIHGDEPIGTDLCLRFCDMLLSGHGINAEITTFVDTTVIWVLPLMNPDGMNNRTRYNANSVDMNRSFPSYNTDYAATLFDGEPLGDANRQPEVAAVMRWYSEQGITLAANFHAGAAVVNYPYDNEPGVSSGQAAVCPDDDLFRDISLRYASLNPTLHASIQFSNGITNGSAWYTLLGGLQDWSYRFLGSLHVTIELSVTKWPSANTLDSYWANNQASMLAYLKSVHMGVRGLVTDRATGTGVVSKVLVENNTQPMFSRAGLGNYQRPLLAGSYNLRWSAPGYITYHVDNIAVADDAETRVDVPLSDGDINGDGQVSAVDIQLVVNAVLGRSSAVAVDADVDGRGISATDVQSVVNRALARG